MRTSAITLIVIAIVLEALVFSQLVPLYLGAI